MDIKKQIKQLYDNRLLKNKDEIQKFNDALIAILEQNELSIITDLCLVFDDETEQFEVMFGLVHGIERLYRNHIDLGLEYIAKAVPSMMDSAKEWVEVLHYRILNLPQTRLAYGKVISKLDTSTITMIRELLLEIKNEDLDMFSELVDEVIKAI